MMSLQLRAEVSRTGLNPAQPWVADLFDWDEPVEYALPIERRPIGIHREPFETFGEAIEYAFRKVDEGGWTWA